MPVLCQAACPAAYLAGVGRRYRCAWDACAVRGKNCQPCDSFAAAPGRAHGCGIRALSKRPRARHELDTRNETRTLFSGNESLYLPNVPGNQFVFTTVRRLLRSGGEAPKKCSTFGGGFRYSKSSLSRQPLLLHLNNEGYKTDLAGTSRGARRVRRRE